MEKNMIGMNQHNNGNQMSKIEVDQVDPQSGTTLTLGTSGDTVTIPSGVTIANNGTATGFGGNGAANWQTTVKTSTFTAVAGEGYFCNTTAGAFTVNLPAGSAGAVVAVKDYADTFDTQNLTISPNGSDKIGGTAADVTLIEEGIAITLVFIDSTRGWLVTDSGLQSEASATYPASFLVIAGGGGGGFDRGGGGGAGGYRSSFSSESSGGGASAETAASLTPGTVYTITVGDGGAGSTSAGAKGTSGNDSSISGSGLTTITSSGGGGGGTGQPGLREGLAGGSGGGAGYNSPSSPSGGSGTANQGFAGADYPGGVTAGGGGGASETGQTFSGGDGVASTITGSSVTRGGGGGGHNGSSSAPPGGSGGGGNGGQDGGSNSTAGTANTGGGGGGGQGGSPSANGAAGGKGVVILRVASNKFSGTTTGSPTVSNSGSDTIMVFNSSGSYTA